MSDSTPTASAGSTRVVSPVTRAADARLVRLTRGLRLGEQLAPLNLGAIRACWQARRALLPFEYGPAPVDLDERRRELDGLALDAGEHPVLCQVLAAKREELRLKLALLAARGTAGFPAASLALYGPLDEGTRVCARAILAAQEPAVGPPGPTLEPDEVGALARAEIAAYRAMDPRFGAEVSRAPELAALLACRDGHLLVGPRAVPRHRVEALLHHEVGTHLLTHYNGRRQPLQVLAFGTADYLPLQEGLAVLAEYLAGGLSRRRLRVLAARVIAVEAMLAGATLPETIAALVGDHGLDEPAAFQLGLRVYRGGGLTKDAVYLQGVRGLLALLEDGVALEPLYLGKVSLTLAPTLTTLIEEGVLRPPHARPRLLAQGSARLALEGLVDRLRPLSRAPGLAP